MEYIARGSKFLPISALAVASCAKISALFSLQGAVKAVENILTVTNNAIHVSCLENSKVSHMTT